MACWYKKIQDEEDVQDGEEKHVTYDESVVVKPPKLPGVRPMSPRKRPKRTSRSNRTPRTPEEARHVYEMQMQEIVRNLVCMS